MSDPATPAQESQPIPQAGPELKQSRTVGKSSGAKDAKSLKANANRTVEAALMPDLDKEKEISERLASRGSTSKPAAIVRRVLKYAEQGYSPTRISQIKRMPHYTTIYTWMREDPDFAEEFKSRYRAYVDDQARQLLPIASEWGKETQQLEDMLRQGKQLAESADLKPFEKVQAVDRLIQRTVDISTALVNAQDKRIHRTLQIAARQLPNDWGEQTEGESNTIIIDVGRDGPTKTLNLPGSGDGQNVKALTAGKWDRKALPAPERDAEGGAR